MMSGVREKDSASAGANFTMHECACVHVCASMHV